VIATLAAGALLSGCGEATAPTGASQSTQPVPPTTSSAPATPKPTITPSAATPSVDEMYTRAATAVQRADSVRIVLTIKNGDDGFTAELSGALDGSNERRSVRASDGTTWTTLWVNNKLYIEANKAWWSLRASARDAALLAGHWVRLKGDVADYTQPPLKKLLLDNLSDWAPGAIRHEVCEVTAVGTGSARSYQAMFGSDKNEFIVDADTWCPSRFTSLDPEVGAATVVLTDWSAVKPFAAPPVYATVELGDR
jgi:hypothetical protein